MRDELLAYIIDWFFRLMPCWIDLYLLALCWMNVVSYPVAMFFHENIILFLILSWCVEPALKIFELDSLGEYVMQLHSQASLKDLYLENCFTFTCFCFLEVVGFVMAFVGLLLYRYREPIKKAIARFICDITSWCDILAHKLS